MKHLLTNTIFCFLISTYVCAQKDIRVRSKDPKMCKIDKIVENINKDTTLVRFKINEDFSGSEIDTSLYYETSDDSYFSHPDITLKMNADSTLVLDTLSNIGRFKWKKNPDYYYVKDSKVVKIIHNGRTFYFLNEKAIMSYKRYYPIVDHTLQCCPLPRDCYHYYWKGHYYKTFDGIDMSGCVGPCLVMAEVSLDEKIIKSWIKQIRKFNK